MSIDPTLQQAIACQQAGQFQEAGELYLSILHSRPTHPEANHNMGVLAVQMGQPAASLPYFVVALDVDPACAQFWLSYIDALFQAGQLDDARNILALAQQQGLEGNDVEALVLRLNDDASTVAPSQKITQQKSPLRPDHHPDPAEIDTLLALCNQGQFAEAEMLARSITLRFPYQGFGWMVLGAVLKNLGRSNDALAPMQVAAELLPGDANVLCNLGGALADLGRLDEAEAALRRALQINPHNAQAHSNLGTTLQSLERLDEAETSLKQALKIDPGLADAHNNLGNTLKGLGRLEEAEASYRRTLEANPGFAAAHYNLGIILHNLGQLEAAEASLRRALQINPQDRAAQNILNNVLRDRGALPDHLTPDVYDTANGRRLRRYFPRESSAYIYSIDVSGTCNLRCPSCPVGNFLDADRPKGFMELELFRKIIEKIKQRPMATNPIVWLFNWGEPMLHPQLAEMISILKQNNLYAAISTNLNIKKNLEEVIRSGPDEIKISLSGITQGFYSKTHTKGNIELVKSNMGLLRELINRYKAPTKVWVGHHLYRHNLHESATVESLCKLLGFDYHPIPAFYQPIEKMVSLIEGRATASEEDFLANLPVHPLEHLERKRARINKDLDCELRFNMTTINYDGSVALCCGVYDAQNMLGVNFLDATHDDIQKLKYQHPFCKKCYDLGLQYSEPMPESTQ